MNSVGGLDAPLHVSIDFQKPVLFNGEMTPEYQATSCQQVSTSGASSWRVLDELPTHTDCAETRLNLCSPP